MDCVCFTQFIHFFYLLTANYPIEPYIDVFKGASSFIPGGEPLKVQIFYPFEQKVYFTIPKEQSLSLLG